MPREVARHGPGRGAHGPHGLTHPAPEAETHPPAEATEAAEPAERLAGPAPENLENLAGRIGADLARRVRTLASAARRTRRRQDPEAIHDLRVAARRLTEALRLWRELHLPAPRRAAARALRRLRRRLGGARELEVHVAMLREQSSSMPVEGGIPAAAHLAALEVRLARRARKASRRVGKRRVQRLLRRLEDSGREIRLRLLANPQAVSLARRRLANRERAARWALAEALDKRDDEALHVARIAVKRWRYALECWRAAYAAPARLPRIRALQEVLGELHDGATLCAELTGASTAATAAESPFAPVLERIARGRVELLERLPAVVARALQMPAEPEAGG